MQFHVKAFSKLRFGSEDMSPISIGGMNIIVQLGRSNSLSALKDGLTDLRFTPMPSSKGLLDPL